MSQSKSVVALIGSIALCFFAFFSLNANTAPANSQTTRATLTASTTTSAATLDRGVYEALLRKLEVLALRFAGAPGQQLAIDTDFLAKKPIYTDRIGRQRLVVLTDKSGANRVYDPQNISFSSYDGDSTAIDESGQAWTLTESALTRSDGKMLPRLPYHRAFWFGWKATFPDTRLVK